MSLARAYGRRNIYERPEDVRLIDSFVDSDGLYFVKNGARVNLFELAHIDSNGDLIPETTTKYAAGATNVSSALFRYHVRNELNPGTTTTFQRCEATGQTMQFIISGTGFPDGKLAGFGDNTWDQTNGFWIYRPDVNANLAITSAQSTLLWQTQRNIYDTGETWGNVSVGVTVYEVPIRFTVTADQTVEGFFEFGWADTADSDLTACVADDEFYTVGRVIHLYHSRYTDFTLREEKTVRVWAVGAGGSGGGLKVPSPLETGSGGGGGAFIEATATLPPGTYRLYAGTFRDRYTEQTGGKSALVRLDDSETIIYAGGGEHGYTGWGAAGGAGGTFKVSPNYNCNIVQGRNGGNGGKSADGEGLNGSQGSPPSDGLRSSFISYTGIGTTEAHNNNYMCGGGAGGSDTSTAVDGGSWRGGNGGSTSSLAGGYGENIDQWYWGYGAGGGGQSRVTISGDTRGGGGGSKGTIVMRFET